MKYIVCGGRDRNLSPLDMALLAAIHRPAAHPFLAGLRRRLMLLEPGWLWDQVPEVVYQGDAPGVDRGAALVLRRMGVHVEDFPADWDRDGKRAGPIRNADMLSGRHRTGQLDRPDAVLAFPGGVGTADMVSKGRAAGRPVLDLAAHAAALAPFQRWEKEDAWLVRSDRAACLKVQASRPGCGPPIMNGHWMKGGKGSNSHGTVIMRPWCLYVGRTCNGLQGHPRLANPFKVRPIGGDTTDVLVQGPNGPERCAEGQALDYYRQHLTMLCEDARVVAELEAIARDRRILVCWCGSSKPCHACVIAEFATGFLAITALRAACPPA